MIWGSLLGLGVSAAAYGLSRNRNGNMMRPVKNMMENMRTRNNLQLPNMAGLTEFSKEILPDNNNQNK